MNIWLDAIGSAVWRASWQAAILALVVVILLRVCGDRLTPHWRFFLWGVVLARLLLVVTPGSAWSMFNLAPSNNALAFPPACQEVEYARIDPIRPIPEPNLRATSSETELSFTAEKDQADKAILSVSGTRNDRADSSQDGHVARFNLFSFSMLSIVWILGCVIATLDLLWTHVLLRRRLSVCRHVTDPVALRLLSICSRQFRLQRIPALLVSPSHRSPFVVGAWNPQIVLPEAMLTDASATRLRHVLAHELAHLVRGDLSINWFLIVGRIMHWFNPIAWWTIREMQAERESACDELAFQVLGDADRTAYASTIVELATIFGPVNLVPGFIGLFSSKGRLQLRVERLLRSPSISKLRTSIAGCLCLSLALFGLTDAMQTVLAQPPKEKVAAKDLPLENNFTLSGHCLESVNRTPLAGVTVKLYRLAGRTQPAVEVASTKSDATGCYVFHGLEKPRPEDHLDRLAYGVLGFAEDRPIGRSFHHFGKNDSEVTEIWMARESSVVFGKVVDSLGRPVEGATVLPYIIMDQPVESLHSTKTDANGEFELEELGIVKWPSGEQVKVHFKVRHPDFPEVMGEAKSLPAEVTVTLPAACIVQGSVTDSVTGKLGVGAVITVRRIDQWSQSHFPTDARGRFRIPLVEGRYDFIVEAKDRVCVATTGHDCLSGEKLELPEMKLIAGGLISGNVVNTVTGEMVHVSDNGDALMLGLIGPSQPKGPVISPHRMAAVDKTGRFVLRAAPGENFPYFVNTRGVRMAWDTLQQPPVIVREGETTTYNMLITPEVPARDRLAAARKLVETLSTKTSERTAQIILEFRKLNHTVDECETWCMLMRELVAIGSDAIPQLSAELDQTTEGPMLRRLAFALRAIGDARAVPALIRAIPKTLQPSSSDYGLMVDDAELLSFMQKWDLDEKNRSGLFGLGRPVREVFGALQKLTGEDFSDIELYPMHLSEDVRCQVLQRNIFGRQAGKWQAWWQAHWKSLTDDTAYQTVGLKWSEEKMPPAKVSLGKAAKISGVMNMAVLSPPIQAGEHAWYFYDLDSGYRPNWPNEIPRNETASKSKQLADWAQNKGVDLMCVTHRSPEGKETFVLRAIGMQVREINARQLRDIEGLVSSGRIPEGRPVGELLMHFDEDSKQYVPDANAAFIFITREGNMGIIEVTDRITRTADLTGQAAGMSTGGIGFHKGVQFNLSRIIP
jgi:beta-lactamase regulating signal transducer with metallopeptidase domain